MSKKSSFLIISSLVYIFILSCTKKSEIFNYKIINGTNRKVQLLFYDRSKKPLIKTIDVEIEGEGLLIERSIEIFSGEVRGVIDVFEVDSMSVIFDNIKVENHIR